MLNYNFCAKFVQFTIYLQLVGGEIIGYSLLLELQGNLHRETFRKHVRRGPFQANNFPLKTVHNNVAGVAESVRLFYDLRSKSTCQRLPSNGSNMIL